MILEKTMKSKSKLMSKPIQSVAMAMALMMPLNGIASIKKDMAEMFNSMGFETNHTKSGAFHSQSGGLVTGGSLSIRSPVSNLTPLNMQLPTISGGCGGIDLFSGSFSFANKEQFIQFVRNLGNNAAGVAFDLALKSLDPMIQDSIGGIRDLVNRVNGMNMSSCEAAKQLTGLAGEKLGASIASGCKASALSDGTADDAADSAWHCRLGSNLVSQSQKLNGNQNSPQASIVMTGGNVSYMALTQHYGNGKLSNADLDFYLSLVGTLVYSSPESAQKENIRAGSAYYPPTINPMTLLGKDKDGKSSADQEKINVELLVCRDGRKRKREVCVNQAGQIDSIKYEIKKVIGTIPNHIISNQSWTDNEVRTIAKYVNNSSYPILKMAVLDASGKSNYLSSDSMIDLIATDYLYQIIHKSSAVISKSLGNIQVRNQVETADLNLLFNNLTELKNSLGKASLEARQRVDGENEFKIAFQRFEEHFKEHFTVTYNSILFDSNNRL